MDYTLLIALGAFMFFCGWKARGNRRTVIIRPSEAQWALSETVHCHMRTIARLKSQITHAEEANQDLRDELALANAELLILRDLPATDSQIIDRFTT